MMMRTPGRQTTTADARPRARRGVTIAEVIVSLSIFGAASLGMIGMAASVGKRGRETNVRARQEAILEQEVNRLTAMPFETLTGLTGGELDKFIAHPVQPYQRKIELSVSPNGKWATVKLYVTPTGGSLDSVIFKRTRGLSLSPLCSGC
jgi:hypothetical protein